MPIIIAYQSFNSNASTDHSLAAASAQHFTKMTSAHMVDEGTEVLIQPRGTTLTEPVQGPAQKLPIAALTGPQTVDMFGGQIYMIGQNVVRALGRMPNILVIGELDASHPDFAALVHDPDILVEHRSALRACQSFTVFVPKGDAPHVHFLWADEGCIVYRVYGLNVAFVHVPNRVVTNKSETSAFYWKIANAPGVHQIVHLVVGDTNQPAMGYTEAVLNDLFVPGLYAGASPAGGIQPQDIHNATFGGTNSTASKMYDVAVYRTDLVPLTGVAYISQSSIGTTVTDHCGIGVRIG